MPLSARIKRAKKKNYFQKIRSKESEIKVKGRKLSNRTYYLKNQEKIKIAARANSKARYDKDPESKRSASHAQYSADPANKLSTMRAYTACNKESLNAHRRDRYALSEPKPVTKEAYLKDLQSNLLGNTKAKAHLIKAFKQQQTAMKRVTGIAACSVAAKRLLNKALQVRKEHAGSLLKTVRTVQSMQIDQISSAEDFGEGCHTASTEPYFYDSACKPIERLCLANR